MNAALTSFITAVFMFGVAIFYVLSCVERSVMNLILAKKNRPSEEDIRFTHASLKRLSPLLPPSNGFVILFGNLALVIQGFVRNWDLLSVLILVIYWCMILYIIFVRKIVRDVKNIKETPNDGPIELVTTNVKNLIIQHHLGLLANLLVVIIEFAIILS